MATSPSVYAEMVRIRWHRVWTHTYGDILHGRIEPPEVELMHDLASMSEVLRLQVIAPNGVEYMGQARINSEVFRSNLDHEALVDYMLSELVSLGSSAAFLIWFGEKCMQVLGTEAYKQFRDRFSADIRRVTFNGAPTQAVTENTITMIHLRDNRLIKPLREFGEDPEYLFGHLAMLHTD